MLKKIFCFSSLAIVIVIFTCPIGITSCTKQTVTDTVYLKKTDTLRVTDTLQEKDTAISTALLTANSWKAIYDRATVGGNMLYYVRGGSSNTMNLDNEYITFNSNYTGVYTDGNGNQTTFTWSFTDSSYTKLTWQWNSSPAALVTWENVFYDNGALHYTEYYTKNGVYYYSQEIRVPK
ncbi:hypothetical protein [Puia dinghuensis]|uniref:DUF4595 domain-containing protein n=1 Tax=Puia dinghuensis TaxID=1792502 RepID=A0A8J2UCZ6_9BACT|nr:hypothetical protein [Puia dinghuensis]GGB00336.1 hypothetical protein GCM10011511_24550 [Puia dinghuensis]